MDIYVCTTNFHLPVEGTFVTAGTTVAKFGSKVATLIGGTQYDDSALYKWIGSPNSLLYLSFVGTIPDPSGGVVVAGAASVTVGNDFVTVVAAFGFVPTSVVVTVIKPSAPNDNLFATVRNDTITAGGFTADLSAPASAPGYILAYIVSA